MENIEEDRKSNRKGELRGVYKEIGIRGSEAGEERFLDVKLQRIC